MLYILRLFGARCQFWQPIILACGLAILDAQVLPFNITTKGLGITAPSCARSCRRGDRMRRRDFITLVGGAGAVWPLIVRARPITAPVVGCLMNQSPGATEIYLCGRLTLSVTLER